MFVVDGMRWRIMGSLKEVHSQVQIYMNFNAQYHVQPMERVAGYWTQEKA